jgi:transcriptional regulator with XRE-family HTH domain
MKISSALSKRILRICKERNISINRLATMCNLTQSTLESLITEKSKNPKLLTVVRICDGLNIPLMDFFDDELFDNIEREE